MKNLFFTALVMLSITASAQRVFVSEDVSRFDAAIFEETNPNAYASWEIYLTDEDNPTKRGNWKSLNSKDSAVFIFRKVQDKELAMFSYRIVNDSNATSFSFFGSNTDVFEPKSYVYVDSQEEANMTICLTTNKWIADMVIYESDNAINVSEAYWFITDKENTNAFNKIKVFVTTNRQIADYLVYFTNNPLEAQIRY